MGAEVKPAKSRNWCWYNIYGICFQNRCFSDKQCGARNNNGSPNSAISNGLTEQQMLEVQDICSFARLKIEQVIEQTKEGEV